MDKGDGNGKEWIVAYFTFVVKRSSLRSLMFMMETLSLYQTISL